MGASLPSYHVAVTVLGLLLVGFPHRTAATTAAPSTDDVTHVDLIFSYFAQNSAAIADYQTTIAGAVNTTSCSIAFDSSGGRVAYFWGNQVRARIVVQCSQTGGVASVSIRKQLIQLATNSTNTILADIGVVSAEAVDSLTAYEYSVFTVWDILWTLLIAAGCSGFGLFSLFVVYRFYNERSVKALEAKLEKKYQAATATTAGPATSIGVVAGARAVFDGPSDKKGHLVFDDDHDDGNAEPEVLSALVQSIAVAKRQDSVSNSASPPRAESEVAGRTTVASEAFTAPTDRVPLTNPLGPTTANGRDLAKHVHAAPPPKRSAVESYLANFALPPPSSAGASTSRPVAPRQDQASAPQSSPADPHVQIDASEL